MLSSIFKVVEGKVPLLFWFMALELSYGHILISMPPCRWIARLKKRIAEYLSSGAINQKNKGTLLCSTFKVGEGKVPLFFLFKALEQSYGHILISIPPCRWIARLKMRKTAYLSPRAINQKNKGTLLSSTFKVGEGKVPLFFWFKALEQSYGHILISMPPCNWIS